MNSALRIISKYESNQKMKKNPSKVLRLNGLGLTDGDMRKLKRFIEGLDGLKQLILMDNKLTYIPLYNLPSLTTLLVHRNNIDSLYNRDLSGYPGLKRLFLYSNKLERIPTLTHSNLIELYLYDNNIKLISNQNLSKLHQLYLDDNPLEKLPTLNTKEPVLVCINQFNLVEHKQPNHLLCRYDISSRRLVEL